MPSFDANTLPATTGIDLGDATHRWDVYAQDLNVSGTETHSGSSTFANVNNILYVDGTTYATIAAAISAASNGDIIFVPRGNYTVALGTLILSKPLRIIGAGPKSTIITFTGASGSAFQFTYDSNSPSGSFTDWGMGLENMTIIGPGGENGGAGNAGTGIELGDATNSPIGVYLNRVRINGFAIGMTWTMASGTSPWGGKFDHVAFNNNDQHLVYAPTAGTGLAQVTFSHVIFNQYTTQTADSLSFGGTQGGQFTFESCFFTGNQITVAASSNNELTFFSPNFENIANTTDVYIDQDGGNVTMYSPTFQQVKVSGSLPSAFVDASAGSFRADAYHATSAQAMTAFLNISGTANVHLSARTQNNNITSEITGTSTGWLFHQRTDGQLENEQPVDFNQLRVARVRANRGTALVAGDFALSGGWGNTASVGSLRGTDQFHEFVITSAGTGQGASPTCTLTYKDGTWTTAPVVKVSRQDFGSQPTVTFEVTTQSATQYVLTFNGTPVAAETFKVCVFVGGI